jgi:uncharacterized protein YbjT (DUF2867 family)
MILVTSADSSAGKEIIRALLKNGFQVRAADIAPRTEELRAMGVQEIIAGDINKLSVLRQCVKGIESILFIPTLFKAGEYFIGKYIIDEAIRAGVKQFILHSPTHSGMSALPDHLGSHKIEEYLVYKGLSHEFFYTIIQPMQYMYNFTINWIKKTSMYPVFYDADKKLSYVDEDDVAEVVVKIAKEPEKHHKATYELVGTDFLSPNEMVKMFNQRTGSRARCERVDIGDYLDMSQIEDVYVIEAFKTLSRVYSGNGLRGNSDILEWLLGRRPTSFRQYLERALRS